MKHQQEWQKWEKKAKSDYSRQYVKMRDNVKRTTKYELQLNKLNKE
jgi:hypothetical protein